MLLIVVLNTAFLCMNGYVSIDSPPYSYINTAFSYVYIADASFKIIAYTY